MNWVLIWEFRVLGEERVGEYGVAGKFEFEPGGSVTHLPVQDENEVPFFQIIKFWN